MAEYEEDDIEYRDLTDEEVKSLTKAEKMQIAQEKLNLRQDIF